MFPEDYFNNISLLAVYGYPHAYNLYNKLSQNSLNQLFYISDMNCFVKSTSYTKNNDSFHIGISCNEDELNNCTCTIVNHNIYYSFIFDGSIENKDELIKKLEDRGMIIQNYSNANLFGLLFLKIKGDINEKIFYLKDVIKGHYNFMIKYEDKTISGCINNPKKRMKIGKLDTGTIIITDDDEHFSNLDVKFEREFKNDETIFIYDNKLISNLNDNKINQICSLNYLYRSNITSTIGSYKIVDIKNTFVSYLNKSNADIITHYPTDPLTYAYEYANINKLNFREIAYYHNNHILYIDNYIKDKIIVVIKENISQFHNIIDYIENLYKRGAKEVHLKVLSPMLNYHCHYNMNEINSNHIQLNETGIKEYLNLSSLEFLTEEKLMLSIRKFDNNSSICIKCINNK